MDHVQTGLILLVEDEALIAMSERLVLERHGYDVCVVATGEEAVAEATASSEIRLVLMDIDLGSGIDGTEAAQRILVERELPIVFLTSHAEQEMVDRVRGITRYGYVMKNSGEFVLLQAIAMARELYQSHREMAEEIRTRRETERQLVERNTFIETILDNLPIGLAVNYIDEGTATYLNRKFEEIYGWPAEEITNISEFFERVYPDPEYREETVGRILADLESGDPTRMSWSEIEVTRKDGTKALVTAKNIPIPEQNFMISTVQDTTGHVNAIRSLEEGPLSEEDFLGRRLRDIFPKEVADRDEPTLKAALEGVTSDVTVPFGGRTHRVITTPVRDGEGTIIGGLVLTQDITRLTETETALREAVQDLEEAISQRDVIIAETNHRIKNNLLTVLGLLQFAEAETGAGLVVNELVTNAVRHGVTGGSDDEIRVAVRRTADECHIEVVNTGRPVPREVDVDDPESMGLRLVQALADQLQGTLSLDRGEETRFVLTFPLSSRATA